MSWYEKKEIKMHSLLLDSSVYISYFNERDIFHRDTAEFIHSVASPDTTFIVPITVPLEVGNILYKTVEKFKYEDLILFFKDHDIVNLDLELASELLKLFKNFNLKTSDAIILAIAELADAALITWDKKLQKEAEKLVPAYTPKSFISKLPKG
ncbi:MAG: type II toxin-antitoxin system VapC family toxin [Actinobacteria bacterium]|nr:type II toxin-antitoxin system VapC family toxin [Actinomycetota bacterium]